MVHTAEKQTQHEAWNRSKKIAKEANEYMKLRRRKRFVRIIRALLMHLLAVHLHICFLLFEKLLQAAFSDRSQRWEENTFLVESK